MPSSLPSSLRWRGRSRTSSTSSNHSAAATSSALPESPNPSPYTDARRTSQPPSTPALHRRNASAGSLSGRLQISSSSSRLGRDGVPEQPRGLSHPREAPAFVGSTTGIPQASPAASAGRRADLVLPSSGGLLDDLASPSMAPRHRLHHAHMPGSRHAAESAVSHGSAVNRRTADMEDASAGSTTAAFRGSPTPHAPCPMPSARISSGGAPASMGAPALVLLVHLPGVCRWQAARLGRGALRRCWRRVLRSLMQQ